MARNPKEISPNGEKLALDRGGKVCPPSTTLPAPLGKRVRDRDPGKQFLNDDFNNVPRRTSLHLAGRTSRKTGGTFQNKRRTVTRANFRDRYGPSVIEFSDDIKALKRRPLSTFARKALVDFLKHWHFWQDVIHEEFPLELAAEATYDVGLRQAQNHLKMLERAGGPEKWFLRRAGEGFAAGKIGRGAATEQSADADKFFGVLALIHGNYDDIVTRATDGESTIHVGWAYKCINALEAQVLEYTLCRYRSFDAEKK